MTSEPTHLQNLNAPQLEAVKTLQGPLLILAGAGSGKTRVLTRRVAHLVYTGVHPRQILAVTFTNKAAAEMRSRVTELVGEGARDILVSTFHSACVRFLRRDATRLGYASSFAIYDDEDQVRVLKAIQQDLGVDPKLYAPKRYLGVIDRAKNRMWSPDDLEAHEKGVPAMKAVEVFRRYEATLKASNAMDFNDLLNQMVTLLENHPDVKEAYHRRFEYLLVDEYQDTNHAQYRLVKALTGHDHNVAVVGDDDQSIYSFRGADIRNILDFEKDFPEAKVIRLEQNYRSTSNILRVSNTLVSHNVDRKEKTLHTTSAAGEPVQEITGADEEEEAVRVVDEIVSLTRRGYTPGDMAIIYRTNASSQPFERALRRLRLPYVVVGGRKFYERREVRDMVSYLRLVLNPSDNMAMQRIVNVPTRGIGDKALQTVRQRAEHDGVPFLEALRRLGTTPGRSARPFTDFAALMDRLGAALRSMPLDALIWHLADQTGYLAMLRAEDSQDGRAREENVGALAREAARIIEEHPDLPPDERARLFLDEATLTGQDQELPDEKGPVTMLTAHLAKGLEFPVVFVVGMVEGSFPHSRSLEEKDGVEEERRLAYVACTRARDRLYLCRSQRRMAWRGAGASDSFERFEDAAPSRFLDELDALESGVFRHKRRLSPPRPLSRPARIAAGGTPPPPVNRRMEAFLASRRESTPVPKLLAPRVIETKDAPPPRNDDGRVLVPESPDLLEVGVRVRDVVYGIGVIKERSRIGQGVSFLIHFERFGPRRIHDRDWNRLQIIMD